MTPYSQDLRQPIVETIQRGDGTIRQVAERFLVSFSFVTRLLQLYRRTGSVEPRPHGGGNPAGLTPEDLQRLRDRDRGEPRGSSPPTPPGVRVRTTAVRSG
jgi:transposase